MRKIKFRAWDKLENTMRLVKSINFADDGFAETILVHLVGGQAHGYVYGESCELLQYTGQKDKDGKEIYEGDIVVYTRVQYTDCSRTVIEAMAPPVVGEVYYADSVWLGLKNSNGSGRILMPGTIDNGEFEIIGNIYENPELLEA